MMKIIFIFLCFLYDISAQSPIIDAFDCNDSNLAPSFSTSIDFCNGAKVKNISSMNISLVQKLKTKLVNALECTMYISASSHICGFENMNHIVEANTIRKPVLLSGKECLNAFNNKQVFFENKIIHVEPSKEIRFKYFLNGTITMGYDILGQQVIKCSPGGIWVDNNFLVDGYQSIEVVFFMEKLRILESTNGFTTLDGKFLGNCSMGCYYKDSIFIITDQEVSIEDKIINSDFRFIKSMTVDKLQIGTSYYLRNKQMGFFVKLLDKNQVCFSLHCLKYYNTEITNLLIFSDKNVFPMIHAFELDLHMEAKLEITSETRLLLNLIDSQPFLIYICQSLTNPHNMHGMIEQYGRMVEFRGEVVVFHQCVKKYFQIDLNIPYPCFKDVFVFEQDKVLLGVAPFTRILVDLQALKPVSCTSFPTFLALADGSFAVNMGHGIEIKYFNHFNDNTQLDFTISDLFSNRERVKSSIGISRKFEEIKTNLYLSQLTSDELTTLQVEPGVWNNLASYISSFDFWDPYSWIKMLGMSIGVIMGFGILWVLIYFGIKRIMNIKCFERHFEIVPQNEVPLQDFIGDQED